MGILLVRKFSCDFYISQFFYFRITIKFLISRITTLEVYNADRDSLLAKTLNSRDNKYANISENQRTNGPVNAHLRPEIYTNKLV